MKQVKSPDKILNDVREDIIKKLGIFESLKDKFDVYIESGCVVIRGEK